MRINANMFGLDRTGGTLVALRCLEALRHRGDEISITTLGRRGDPRNAAEPEGFDVTYLGLRSRPYKALVRVIPGHLGFPGLEMTRLALNASRADLQLATYCLTALPSSQLGDPVLYHAQHFEPLIVPPGKPAKLALESYRLGLHQTANCSWVAQRIAEAGGHVRAVIPPGIDLSVFRPDIDVDPADRRKADERAPLRVLTLGKRAAWKGLRDVVDAVAAFAQISSRPVELVTYGPDAPTRVPRQLAQTHHGLVGAQRLAELYRASDVYVSASWYEAFPLPPLEAMACGTPVICTRLGTEDYATDGTNCILVPSKDPQAIVRALQRLGTDPDLGGSLVEEGLRTAAQFTWSRAEIAFLAECDRAVGVARGGGRVALPDAE